MRRLDRYILVRFALNFAILFALLFVFAVAIDLLLNLDRFVSVGREVLGDDLPTLAFSFKLAYLIAEFQLPRVSQFYGYLHGLVAVGAMAFTLAQMHRYKELVAVMASGVSLSRVAMPFLAAAFAVSLVQLVNQEMIAPRVAPLLLRGHDQLGEETFNRFPVPFTPDGDGALLHAAAFVPGPEVPRLEGLTIIERDERGRTTRRITAPAARWDDDAQAWVLEEGIALSQAADPESARSVPVRHHEPISRYHTSLTPQALTLRRHAQYAAFLSLEQIREMLASPDIPDRAALIRYKYARFAYVLVNLLIMGLCLPTFLLREPTPLLKQSVICAAVAVPAMIGAAIGMTMNLPGIPPTVGVFLPVVILGLLVLARWTYFKT